jgi:hypothetical protein
MNAFTPLLIFGALAAWGFGCTSELSSERSGEVDSAVKAFVQHGLDRSSEAYLICIFQAETTGGSRNEVEIHATVVDCIKGKKRVGRGSRSGGDQTLGPGTCLACEGNYFTYSSTRTQTAECLSMRKIPKRCGDGCD